MKKILIFIIIMCSTSANAVTTTIRSSILSGQTSESTIQQPFIYPLGPRKVHIINRIDTLPEADIALSAAESVFSSAMKQEQIDLVDIKAELMMGKDDMIFAQDEICKVDINYTSIIMDNSRYHNFSTLYSELPVLYPIIMANQCSNNSDSIGLRIYLNPAMTYNCDTTVRDTTKYDLMTVALRALAMGCGIQSSLDPNSMEFGVEKDGQKYITAFDTQIYNDSNQTFTDVAVQNISQDSFLTNHEIYVQGFEDWYEDPLIITLFNDWIMTNHMSIATYKTLNTIDYSNYVGDEETDLMDESIGKGMIIRHVTKYTMAILRKLGWLKTIPVGYQDPYVEELYNCTLQCDSAKLSPNNQCTLSITPNGNVWISNAVCEIFSTDSSYVIGNIQNNTFSYSSIPQYIQWRRNPITKNIIGRFRATTATYTGDNQYMTLPKTCEIEIPYKPNRPIIQKSESTENNYIQLHLKVFANGSNTYTISYTGVTYADVHTFTISAIALDTIIANIPANQLYNMSIYGSNNQGNSDVKNFTFGFSAHPTLNMTVSAFNNTLIYDLSNNGTIDISDVVINSVTITDMSGLIWLTPNYAGSGDPISISSLARGRYILTVVADGESYSRMFVKR